MRFDADPSEHGWLYPLHMGAKLATNDWVEWHFHSFLDSSFVLNMLYEDRRDIIGVAAILWSASYRQDPAGTLPDDDIELAHLAGFGTDIKRWQEVRDRALWGWSRCALIDDDLAEPVQGRLGHRKLIASIASRSAMRKDGRKASREQGAMNMMRSRLRHKLTQMGRLKIAENPNLVSAIAKFLTDANLYCNDTNIAAALESVAGIPRVVGIKSGAGGL